MEGDLPEQAAGNEETATTHRLRRLTMNAFVSALYRDVTCAAASALITLVLALSFVQSTSVPPGAHAPASAVAARQQA
jgi:hypothetical protein